jgi:hypothetical protein
MNIIEPTKQQLDDLVEPFLARSNVGFAIGYASPQFQECGKFYFKRNGPLLNQANQEVPLGKDTYFEIASISKVFTATLFQLLVQNDAYQVAEHFSVTTTLATELVWQSSSWIFPCLP